LPFIKTLPPTLVMVSALLSACAPSGASSSASLPSRSVSGATSATPLPPPRPSNGPNERVCAGVDSLPGIDVSDYDPGTQWTVVKHSGVDFTFIKASEGIDYTNPYFVQDWAAAPNNGIFRGAYHFFHPKDDPTLQAQHFLKVMGKLQSNDLPAMFDWESNEGVSAAEQIKKAKVWLQLVEAATGKTPIIYVSPSYWNALGNPQEFERYPLFIAHYDVTCPEIPPPWSQWTFWQRGTGPAAGVQAAEADLDVFNGSLTQLLQLAQSSK